MTLLLLFPDRFAHLRALVEETAERLGLQSVRLHPGDLDGGAPDFSEIDQASGIIAVLEPAYPGLMVALGYALGTSKLIQVFATNAKSVPSLLSEVPYVSLEEELTTIGPRVALFLEDLKANPPPAIGERMAALEVLKLYQSAPALFEQLSPQRFEQAVRTVFQDKGLSILAATEQDYGFTFAATAQENGDQVLVDVKKWKQHSKPSITAVQQLYGAVAGHHAHQGILISSSGFSPSAQAFARKFPQMQLWDMERLLRFAEGVEDAEPGRAPEPAGEPRRNTG